EDPRLDAFYHLKPGSPAIDAGLTLPWLNVDLEEKPRPLGAGYDAGAFEWDPAAIQPGLFLPLVVRLGP
ncbi:MAG: choice-of-anchor Q domain-containing protein, partial [Anaerolineales bacterium]